MQITKIVPIRLFSSLAILAVAFFSAGEASDGDQKESYRQCYAECLKSEDCEHNTFPVNQLLLYRLLQWDCPSECQYNCMWEAERQNRQLELPSYQYFGKWPFYRVMGMQEVCSAIFSLGNLLAHWYGYYRIYQGSRIMSSRLPQWFMHGPITANYFVSINAWWWSFIFHTRDIQATMYLDYVSAMGLLIAFLNLALVRVFNIQNKKRQIMLVAIPLIVFFLHHTRYMLRVKFDFGWNMKVAITIGAFSLFIFIIWSTIHLAFRKRHHSTIAILACFTGIGAALLEINDFPPLWGLVDAHALWHAATIPIVLMWYLFYRQDSFYDFGFTVPSKGGMMISGPE